MTRRAQPGSLQTEMMVDDLAVLLVGSVEPSQELSRLLENEGIVRERTTGAELAELLDAKQPALVVHFGAEGASATVQALQAFEKKGRRVRVVIVAERGTLPQLRKLDRAIVGSLLATDMPPGVVSARITMLARKGALRRAPTPTSPRETSSLAPLHSQRSIRTKSPLGAFEDSALLAISSLPPSGEIGRKLSRRAPAPRASLPPRSNSSASEAADGKSHSPDLPPAPAPSPRASPRRDIIPPPALAADGHQNEARAASSPAAGSTTSDLALRPSAELRVLVADLDMTRGDAIAQGIREAGVRTLLVPLDPALTRWDLARRFRPTLLVADGATLKRSGQVWFQLFQADRAFGQTRLASVVFGRIFDEQTGAVDLRMLIPHVPLLAARSRPEYQGVGVGDDTEFDSAAHERATLTEEDFVDLLGSVSASALSPNSAEESDSAAGPRGEAESVESSSAWGATEVAPEELPSDIILPSLEEIVPRSSESEAAELGDFEPSREELSPVFAVEAELSQEGVPSSHTTPPPLEHRVSDEARPSAPLVGRWAWAAVAIIALGGAGTYAAWEVGVRSGLPFSSDARSASTPSPAFAAPASAASTRVEASNEETEKAGQGVDEVPHPDAPEELTERAAFDPWVLPPDQEVPSCDALVPNVEEVREGGVGRAALSWNRAKKSLVLGDLGEAHQQLCDAVLSHPESYALEGLVEVLLSLHAAERAEYWVGAALRVRPERRKTRELLGDVQSQLGQPEQARATWAASIQVEPEDERTLRLVGDQYVVDAEQARKSGDRARAERLYRRAVTLSPENAEAAVGLANTFLAWNDAASSRPTLEWAEHWAEEALRLQKGQSDALVLLADVAQLRGKKMQAIELYKRALESAPGNARAHQQIYQLEH